MRMVRGGRRRRRNCISSENAVIAVTERENGNANVAWKKRRLRSRFVPPLLAVAAGPALCLRGGDDVLCASTWYVFKKKGGFALRVALSNPTGPSWTSCGSYLWNEVRTERRAPL